jgi:hypothetical protein
VRERDDADVDGVETMRDEACIEFARLRNTSWMNARTSVANIRHTKVGTTMNRCKKRRAFSHCFFSSSRHEEEEGTFLPVAHYCQWMPWRGPGWISTWGDGVERECRLLGSLPSRCAVHRQTSSPVIIAVISEAMHVVHEIWVLLRLVRWR